MKNKKRSLILFLILITLIIALLSSCTKNQRVKTFGGKATIELPRGQKLINCTWKEGDNFWYLTRPMGPKDSAEVYTFQEKSSLGLVEGTYIIKEVK
jgi:hypothetical protein